MAKSADDMPFFRVTAGTAFKAGLFGAFGFAIGQIVLVGVGFLIVMGLGGLAIFGAGMSSGKPTTAIPATATVEPTFQPQAQVQQPAPIVRRRAAVN